MKYSNFNDRVKRAIKIGREYGRTKGSTELAKEYGLSKQRVEQIATQLRKRGVDIPRIKFNRESAIDVAVDKLNKLK